MSIDPRDFPSHLRPVPDPGMPGQDPGSPSSGGLSGPAPGGPGSPLPGSSIPESGDSTAPAIVPEEGGTAGVTPPRSRGRSHGFVTDVLVALGYVSQQVADQAIEQARTAGQPPEQLMVSRGVIDADQLSRAIAERYGLDHVDLSAYQVDMAAANLIPVGTARRYKALPVGFVDKTTLLVAMADPTNLLAVEDIEIATALGCRKAVAAEEDIESLIGRLNTLQSAVSEAVTEDQEAEEETG